MSANVRARDEVLLVELASGASQQEAARKAGCCAKTVQRRMADPDFREKLSRMRERLTDQVLGVLAAGAVEAAKDLVALHAATQDERIRLQADLGILDKFLKYREQDIEQRLERIRDDLDAIHGLERGKRG